MTHSYYTYDKARSMENPKIPLICMENNEAVFKAMAREMVEEIEKNNNREQRTVFICPVGPVGQYPYFVDMVNENNIPLKDVWFINMDEYLDDDKQWVDKNHPLSFRGFMERSVYGKLKPELLMPKTQRVFPDPNDITCIPKLIEKLGGVDIAFGGIGINGHVAFNEADAAMTSQEFLAQRTRVLAISPETITANAIGDFGGALEDMPKYCVTIGMREIAGAKKIRLGCFRNWHRAVVRRAAYGETGAEFPVSLLRDHPDITLTFTDYVAALGD